MLVGMPLLIAALRLGVAFSPSWPTLFAAELCNYMLYQVQMTPVDAALGDLFNGEELAKATSRYVLWRAGGHECCIVLLTFSAGPSVLSVKGLSSICGQPAGVWLCAISTQVAHGAAGCAGLLSAAVNAVWMPETLAPAQRAASHCSGDGRF